MGDEWQDFNGTYALPRWRNVFQVSADWRSWEGNLSYAGRRVRRHAHPWTASDPSVVNDARHVGTNEQWDISLAYTGFKNWRLAGGIINLWDKTPPFSATNLLNNQYSSEGFAELYSARCRFFHVEATYTFK